MTSPATSAASSSSAPPEPALTAPRGLGRALYRGLVFTPGLLPALTFLTILVVWEAATVLFAIPSFVLPSPSRIATGFSSITTQRWVDHVWSTLRVALIGYGVSIAIALPLAIALTRSEFVNRALYPILVVIQATPVVAVAPIIIVVLGANDAPRIVITFLIAFFPLVVSTATGLLATPKELIELSKSLRAPAWREVTQIRLPYAIPYIFAALKISITLAVIGAVVAEFVAAEKGIGYFIQFSTSMFRLPEAWAGLGILVLMSLLLFQMVSAAQRMFFPWSLPKAPKE
jgi:NitT/TauT family transport system permease protein